MAAQTALEPAGDPPFSEPVDHKDRSAAGAFRVPFSILDAFVATVAYFVGQLIAGFGASLLLLAGGGELDATTTLAIAVASQVLGLALAIGYLLLRRRLTWRVLGPVRPSWLLTAVGLGIGVAGFLLATTVNAGLAVIFEPEDPVQQAIMQEAMQGGAALVFAFIAAVIMAPLAEEFLFRGLLFQAVSRRLGFWVGAVVSSALFTIVHVEIVTSQPLALAGLFTLGVFLAWSMQRTGSLLVPTLAHAVFNGVTLTLAVLVERLGIDQLIAVVGVAGLVDVARTVVEVVRVAAGA